MHFDKEAEVVLLFVTFVRDVKGAGELLLTTPESTCEKTHRNMFTQYVENFLVLKRILRWGCCSINTPSDCYRANCFFELRLVRRNVQHGNKHVTYL